MLKGWTRSKFFTWICAREWERQCECETDWERVWIGDRDLRKIKSVWERERKSGGEKLRGGNGEVDNLVWPLREESFLTFPNNQCDQIGRFLIVVVDKFSYTSCPNVCWLFGLLWKNSLWSKNYCGHFLGNFWNNCATFYISIWSHCSP